MTELMETLVGLSVMTIENELGSKVEGRRNWVIRTEKSPATGKLYILYSGGYGEASRKGLLQASLSEICKYSVRWYEFTYKADYLEALDKLTKAGYTKW